MVLLRLLESEMRFRITNKSLARGHDLRIKSRCSSTDLTAIHVVLDRGSGET
jgi:hypothetical protein